MRQQWLRIAICVIAMTFQWSDRLAVAEEVSALPNAAVPSTPIPGVFAGGSIPSATVTPGSTTEVVVTTNESLQALKIKEEILAKVNDQISAGRFPYFDHRPHETAEKLAAILSSAAADAKKISDSAGADRAKERSETLALRNQVLQKVDALLKQRSGRTLDWKWIVVTAQNIEKRYMNESWAKLSDDEKSKGQDANVIPNPTRGEDLAYVYNELAQAASALVDILKQKRAAEDEIMARAIANGGITLPGDSAGWVTVSDPTRRRGRGICRWLAP